MESVGYEVLESIFLYLAVKDLCALCLTTKFIREAAISTARWHDLFRINFQQACLNNCCRLKEFHTSIASDYGWKFVYKCSYLAEKKKLPSIWLEICWKQHNTKKTNRDKECSSKELNSFFLDLFEAYLEENRNKCAIRRKSIAELARITSVQPKVELTLFIEKIREICSTPLLHVETITAETEPNSDLLNHWKSLVDDSNKTECTLGIFTYREMSILSKKTRPDYSNYHAILNASRFELQKCTIEMCLDYMSKVVPSSTEEVNQYSTHFIDFLDERFWLKSVHVYRCVAISRVSRLCETMPVYTLEMGRNILEMKIPELQAALMMTTFEHTKLCNISINEFIDFFERMIYRHDDHLSSSSSSRRRNPVEMYLNSSDMIVCNVVHAVTAMQHENALTRQVSAVCYLIRTARLLRKMNNFASLKQLLASVRGIVSNTSSPVSWKNIPYSYLKSFVDLESTVSEADNYKTYHGAYNDCLGHRIPLLQPHISLLSSMRPRQNDADGDEENALLGYCTRKEVRNCHVIEESAKIISGLNIV